MYNTSLDTIEIVGATVYNEPDRPPAHSQFLEDGVGGPAAEGDHKVLEKLLCVEMKKQQLESIFYVNRSYIDTLIAISNAMYNSINVFVFHAGKFICNVWVNA